MCACALALARACVNGALARACVCKCARVWKTEYMYMNIYLDIPLIKRYVSKTLSPYDMGNEEYFACFTLWASPYFSDYMGVICVLPHLP